MSNFSFSHSVFKRLILQTRKNQGLFGKVLTLPRRQILDSSKLKEFADDNFEFNENGRKSSERTENTVGKGEIPQYEEFLLFPQCFLKDSEVQGLFWKGLTFNHTVQILSHYHTTNFRLFITESVCSPLKGQKTLWEKGKFLNTSNFSFSHSVF